jgi:glucose/mannose-6-phosphate isomerase
MTDLDDPEIYQQLDPSKILSHLHKLPQQCRQAWTKAMQFYPSGDYSEIDKVILLGMGGSALGGDLLSGLAALQRVPLFVHRDYGLPYFADKNSLLIASSYSGMTEETISSFAQALNLPAKKLVITSGGQLKDMAEKNDIPLFLIDYQAPPRAALGFVLTSLLGIFQRLRLLSDKSAEVAEMLAVMEDLSQKINEGVPQATNPAKQLAGKLYDRLILIYGAGILSEVAHRWKTQFNENSKAWAFHESLPELNHNAIVGYEFPPKMAAKIFVVLLRSPSLHPRMLTRYQITAEILGRAGIKHQIIDAAGDSPLSQAMSLVLFGDYVSYYLALLYRTDPTPVAVIDYLKEKLAQSQLL